MTKAEEMAMKTVHDLGIAGASDVQNYMGLSANKATRVLDSLANKGYLESALWKLTPKGRKAAKKIPDIDEPMCIPITNIPLEKMEERKDGAD